MSIKGLFCFAVLISLFFVPVSVYAEKKDKNKNDPLSFEERARVNSYSLISDSIYIDELQEIENHTFFPIDPYTEAYEGMRLIRLLGLHNSLSVKDQFIFIDAVFNNIPQDTIAAGIPIRNIVVPKWYTNGSPLILHITKVFTGNKVPSILILFNTQDGIRDLDADYIKALLPGEEYPCIVKNDTGMFIRAKDYYTIKILPNTIVSGSGAVGKTLPDLNSITNILDKINMTDNYLRDGDPDNDALVEPVLKEAISNKDVAPLNKLHATIQLFMYYLFSKDINNAEKIAKQIPTSIFMSEDAVSTTEIAEFANNDLIPMIKIVKTLNTRDLSFLE